MTVVFEKSIKQGAVRCRVSYESERIARVDAGGMLQRLEVIE